MSRQCGPREHVRLLSIFARRPKITWPHDDRLVVKLNAELFQVAHIAPAFGIPVFAGVPTVASIAELTLDAPCHWYHLAPESEDIDETEITINRDGSLGDTRLPDHVTGPLGPDGFIRIIHAVTQPMTWNEGIDNLHLIRSHANLNSRHTRFFGGGYKPFHVMLMDGAN